MRETVAAVRKNYKAYSTCRFWTLEQSLKLYSFYSQFTKRRTETVANTKKIVFVPPRRRIKKRKMFRRIIGSANIAVGYN